MLRRLAVTVFGVLLLAPATAAADERDYVRGDFHRTPAMHAANRMFRRALRWDTTHLDERLSRTVKRLEDLGVPTADAETFDGLSDY